MLIESMGIAHDGLSVSCMPILESNSLGEVAVQCRPLAASCDAWFIGRKGGHHATTLRRATTPEVARWQPTLSSLANHCVLAGGAFEPTLFRLASPMDIPR